MSGSHTAAPYGLDVSDAPRRHGRIPLLVRLRTFFTRAKLDSLLAGGADPSSSPDLELRATQLAGTRFRRRYANSLRKIVAVAEEPPRGLYGAEVAVNRREVLAARSAMLDLAEALEASAPADPRGVAITAATLRDGNSPLYAQTADGELSRQMLAAHDGLLGLLPPDPRR